MLKLIALLVRVLLEVGDEEWELEVGEERDEIERDEALGRGLFGSLSLRRCSEGRTKGVVLV